MSEIQFIITIPIILAVFYFGFKFFMWAQERKER
jgi:hypothetical protein